MHSPNARTVTCTREIAHMLCVSRGKGQCPSSGAQSLQTNTGSQNTYPIFRPSNSQINRLKEENARLRKLVEKLQYQPNAEQTRIRNETLQTAASDRSNSIERRDEDLSHEQRVAKIPWTAARDQGTSSSFDTNASAESHGTQFHGPSSAMFDGEHAPQKKKKIGQSVVVDGSHKIQLLAEAAKQRMLLSKICRNVDQLTTTIRSIRARQLSFRKA
jgi:hypothetical protein